MVAHQPPPHPAPALEPARLSLSRDGRTAAAIAGGEVRILDVASGRVAAADVAGAGEIAAFDDQIWVVAAAPRRLVRLASDGGALGEPLALPAGERLHRATGGGAAAVWQAQPPVELHDDLGALRARPLDEAITTAFPAHPRLALGIRRDGALVLPQRALLLPDRAAVRWAAWLHGGASLVLLTRVCGDAGARDELRVLSVRDGRQVHRLAIPPPRAIAVAAQVGRLVVRGDGARVLVVDARLGRVVLDADADAELEAIALDERGGAAVLRGGAIEVGALEGLIAARAVGAGVGADPEADADPGAEVDAEVDAEAAAEVGAEGHAEADADEELAGVVPPALRAPPALLALGVAPAPPAPGGRARAALDAERDVAGARALLGIARAWDTRRIGFPSESAQPFELEVAALLGIGGGHAVDHVAAAAARLDAALARRAAAAAAPELPAAALARELELSPLERELLLLVAAPTLWGEMARLYGVLANDPGRAIVDEHLLGQLLDGAADRYDVAAALAPDAPLIARGAIRAGDRARPFAPLVADPVVCARLRGEPAPAIPGVEVRAATRRLDELVAPQGRLARLVDELAAPRPSPLRLVVRGRRASGRRTLVAALAAAAGRDLGVVDVGALAGRADLAEALRRALLQAALRGLVPCLVGAEAHAEGAPAVADVVRAHPGPLAAIAEPDGAAPFDAGHVVVDLPALAPGARRACWATALARHGLAVDDPELLAARLRLPPGAIEVAAATARAAAPAPDATPAIEDAVRQLRDRRLGRLATRVERLATWSELVLPPDILDGLRELVGRVRHGRTVYEAWGFDRIITTGRGLTALFEGRPGTGKTMVAGVLARELGLDLYRVDVSRLVSKWIGETEKHLAEIFDAVDDGQAIVLFDEADSLFGKRTEVKTSNDRYANLEVNYLLQRLDAFEGIALLTTNFGSAIDPAFKRRLSFRITFPFPDEDAREALWRCHLPRALPTAGDLDLAALARRYQMSGGYIRNACLRAAFLAAQEHVPVTHAHLERACVLEYQQLGKLSTSGPVD